MCEGDGSAGVGFDGGVVAVSAYLGGIRGSGGLACSGDVLEISVVRGVGGVYDMCMCLARGGVGGVGGYQDWVWALPHGGVGGVGGEWAAWARVWEGGVVLCLCVL